MSTLWCLNLSCTSGAFMWLLGKADLMPSLWYFITVRKSEEEQNVCSAIFQGHFLIYAFYLHFIFKIFENFVKWNFKKALFGKSWTWISPCLKESISNWLMLLPLPLVHKHTLVNPKRRIPVLGSHLNIFIWSWNKTNYLLNFNFHWYKFATMPSKCLQKLMENEANKSIPSFMYFCWGYEKLRSWGGSTAPSLPVSHLSLILPKKLLLTPFPASSSQLPNWDLIISHQA